MKSKRFYISVLCVLAIFISTINVYATDAVIQNINLTENTIATENKIICNATLDDDFADDSVIVVINKEYSKKETNFLPSHFKNIEIAEIESLTTPISNLTTASATAEEAAEKAETLALTNVENFRQIIEIKLKNKGKENVLKAIKELEKIDYIESAEPNYYFYPTPIKTDLNEQQIIYSQEFVNENAQPIANVPNDFDSRQYALNKIQATNAWDITTGSKSIRVGIIDSGICNHPDLSGNLVSGWDFYNNNDNTTDDYDGHGTHVAGIIGAAGDNDRGICGINWNVSLVPLQVSMYDEDPAPNGMHFFNYSAVGKAIDYARTNNIPIINCSFGSYIEYPPYKASMENYNGLIACAAGNGDDYNPLNTDIYYFTPSCFSFENIISVAATTQSDALVSYSNYGATTVDLAAPGYQIYSTIDDNSCDTMSGTSMAAPHVTGVAALIKSVRPDLSATQIKACILNGTDAVPALSGLCVTGGRLNAYKALQLAIDFPKDQMVSGDFDGNGNDDIAYITDTGYGSMKIYVRLNGEGAATLWSEETEYYTVNVGDRVAAGDFNGDGKDDIALMYDNKNARTRIHVLLSNGSGFNSRSSWYFQLTEGMYDANRATGRFTAGDFNGDGKDDISVMYDNGSGKMRIHMFLSTGGGFNLEYWYEDMAGGNFYADGVTGRYAAGDFNGDGKDDIAAMYGYSDGRTRTHVWLSTGASLQQRTAWFIQDTPHYYDTDRVNNRFVAGDFNDDGKDDIATLYKYNNGTMMLHVFVSQGSQYSWWQNWFHSSAEGSFYTDSVKAFNSGDYNGDGKMDIMARYTYSGGYSKLLKYQSTGSAFSYASKFLY